MDTRVRMDPIAVPVILTLLLALAPEVAAQDMTLEEAAHPDTTEANPPAGPIKHTRSLDLQSPTQAIGYDELVEWDIRRMSSKEVVDYLDRTIGGAGVGVEIDGNAKIGPIKGVMSPRQLLEIIAEANCAELTVVTTGAHMILRKPSPPLNHKQFQYDIPRGDIWNVLIKLSRQSGRIGIGYLTASENENIEVGPIKGMMTPLSAIMKLLAEAPSHTFRWSARENLISIEPKALVSPEQDLMVRGLAGELCRVVTPPLLDPMLVTAQRWPSFADVTSPTIVGRERIDESGTDNLPDLLQQLSQTAFHRGPGYRPWGTQCAALRGVAAVKVMINGKPMFGSATDFFEDECVDLNAIPLSAVERIEVSPDAVSLAHGADSIGGAINIVLKEGSTQSADARYQGAQGGAGVLRSSIVAGASDNTWLASLVLDYSEMSSLTGSQRERWKDQDFQRFGGRDYRSVFSAPPNIRALGGTNLPGLSSAIAAVTAPSQDTIELKGGEENRSSLLAWQSIVPELRRMNVSAIAEHEMGTALVRSEFLMADRSSSFQYPPDVIPGFVLGEHHPQNPFGMPVMLSAALTGLALPEQDVHSTLLRGVLQVDGTWSKIDYKVYALHSTEEAENVSRHFIDYEALSESLSGQRARALNVLTDRPGLGGEYVWAPNSTVRSLNGGTIVSASARANVLKFPAGSVSAHIGGEVRREFADYGNLTGKLDRKIASAFGILQLPIVDRVKATVGTRRDAVEQINHITSNQYSLEWKPISRLQLSASYNDTFAPPRMFDLYFPVQSFATMIFDPSSRQLEPVRIVSGGNESLKPTVGRSATLGLLYGAPDDPFRASIDLWNVSLKDRISGVLPQTLIAYEDSALDGRIVRDSAGRLVALDVRRANFGATETRGIDASIDATFRTEIGRFTPRFDVTYTDDFRYGDLPSLRDPGRERTGVADILGTITRWRLRGVLSYRHRGWNANALTRWNSCYEDFDTALGIATGRVVCPGITLDLNISKEIGEHFEATIGASDVFDSSPMFSEVSSQDGYDSSQGDLVGRTVFISISGRL